MLIANKEIENKFKKDIIENNRVAIGVKTNIKKVGFMHSNFQPNFANL
jgi:hypothetical protein